MNVSLECSCGNIGSIKKTILGKKMVEKFEIIKDHGNSLSVRCFICKKQTTVWVK